MTEWIYRREDRHGGCIVEPVDGQHWNHLIAQDVSPEHGPRIALAPRMERVLRGLSGLARGFGAVSTCGCYHCSAGRLIAEAMAILREIDAARGPAEKPGEATAS